MIIVEACRVREASPTIKFYSLFCKSKNVWNSILIAKQGPFFATNLNATTFSSQPKSRNLSNLDDLILTISAPSHNYRMLQQLGHYIGTQSMYINNMKKTEFKSWVGMHILRGKIFYKPCDEVCGMSFCSRTIRQENTRGVLRLLCLMIGWCSNSHIILLLYELFAGVLYS